MEEFGIIVWPRLCEKSRAIVKLDIFSKTLRTFVVLSGIALTGPKCGTLINPNRKNGPLRPSEAAL